MLIIGLDFETTGLSAEKDRVTEIGAVIWDTQLKSPVGFYHQFIKQSEPLTPEIVDLTGITDELLNKYGVFESEAFMRLQSFLSNSDTYVAHNAPFDKGFLDAGLARQHIRLENKKWIDTVKDVPYPKKVKNKDLMSLAAFHGFVNPFPHRAITDVLTMLGVLSHYDVEECLKISQEPKITLWARVTYAEKDNAKRAGFYYQGDKKQWYKEIRLNQLEEETKKCEALGFAVEVIRSENKEKTTG